MNYSRKCFWFVRCSCSNHIPNQIVCRLWSNVSKLNYVGMVGYSSSIPQHSKNDSILQDSFGRLHTYLRISLTERCNLRCTYCMPKDGITLTPKPHLLNTNEILKLAKLFVKQGVTKIRLTGGEPTVHKDLKYIIEYLRDLKSLDTIAMTTNGITLSRQLADLQKAGLNALNISLDTLNADKFETITRHRGVSRVLSAIDLALQLGYDFVKVNCVVIKDVNDNEVLDFVELTKDRNIHVRFIEYMPFGGNKWHSTKIVTYTDLVNKIQQRYPELVQLEGNFNDTSKPYQVPGFVGQLGFISSISDNFCGSCNRLRLLADGSLKVCLLGSAEISLRDALRNGCSEDDILTLINAAVMRKKKQHADNYTSDNSHHFQTKSFKLHFPNIFCHLCPANSYQLRTCSTLTHVSSSGDAIMVDVSSKEKTLRCASAYAEVYVGEQIVQLIHDNLIKKGDVLSVAKLAGIIAAKKTADLIPLCHNITLTFADVMLEVDDGAHCVKIYSEVRCHGQTGVEMEALTAATISALTVYDMCKAICHNIRIGNIQLLKKTGGKKDFVSE